MSDVRVGDKVRLTGKDRDTTAVGVVEGVYDWGYAINDSRDGLADARSYNRRWHDVEVLERVSYEVRDVIPGPEVPEGFSGILERDGCTVVYSDGIRVANRAAERRSWSIPSGNLRATPFNEASTVVAVWNV